MASQALHQLNFRHLYYFWTVAGEMHLTRAAARLHVSQSAVSSQLRQLEDSLGHALFHREGRQLRLTEVGTLVLAYADGIFKLGAELVETVSTGADQQRLRVGAVSTLSRNFQENLLRPVLGDPELRLVLESARMEELLERLRLHRLDLVLSNRPVSTGGSNPLRCRRIARQAVVLVGPPRPRANRFRFPRDLDDEPLILPGRNSDVRQQFDLLCEAHGLKPRLTAEVEDMAMLRLMSRDSQQLAVVPEVVVQDELASGELEKYCELPDIHENFYAITAQRHFEPSALRAILDAADSLE